MQLSTILGFLKSEAGQKVPLVALQIRFSEPAQIIPVANSQQPGKAAADLDSLFEDRWTAQAACVPESEKL